MTDEQLLKLKENDVDTEGAMERFLDNRDMYEKFLKKFLNDANYSTLVGCIQNNDTQGAFSAAHALKGVSSNLSLQTLYHVISKQVEFLREDQLSPAKEMMPEVSIAYDSTINLIKSVFQAD